MANPSMLFADNISAKDFADYLAKYDSCIEALSESKGSRGNERSLADLDKYRYEVATAEFGSGKPKRPMELDDVKTLVSWKLRHGKFRPTLMKLVSSNDPVFAKETVQDALNTYKKASDASAAIAVLTKLKGIGPATASLLLAVHDPQNVIFFADEAFYWLCCGGKRDPIKYNAKEYAALNEQAQTLCRRLGVQAVDVERVAFVMLQQAAPTSPKEPKDKGTAKSKDKNKNKDKSKDKSKAKSEVAQVEASLATEKPKSGPAKRKASSEASEVKAPLRRSKRRANET